MTILFAVRIVTVLAFIVALWGMSRGWDRRTLHLTKVGKRQYVTYYLLIVVTVAIVTSNLLHDVQGSWQDAARLLVGLLAAFTSNWRLYEEEVV
jgi:hypothetical protein